MNNVISDLQLLIVGKQSYLQALLCEYNRFVKKERTTRFGRFSGINLNSKVIERKKSGFFFLSKLT